MILVYVDAENVSFAEFRDFALTNLNGKELVGKVYGNSDIIGDAAVDYSRIGFNFIDTKNISSTSKNVADMKIVTDCAFDTMHGAYDRSNLSVILITKDHDFMPLVYRLQGLNIRVLIPSFASTEVKDGNSTREIALSAVSEVFKSHNYAPMSTHEWILPQLDYVTELFGNELPYNIIDKYFSRKRTRFIRDVAINNELIAFELDKIPKHEFGAKNIVRVLQKNRIKKDEIIAYLDIYTKKFFGITIANRNINKLLLELSREEGVH